MRVQCEYCQGSGALEVYGNNIYPPELVQCGRCGGTGCVDYKETVKIPSKCLCGSQPTVRMISSGDWQVICKHCGRETVNYFDRKGAVENWNFRTEEQRW